MWWQTVVIALYAYLVRHLVSALRCNYCFNANIQADCRINSIVCKPGSVCFVSKNTMTYTSKRGQATVVTEFKMGCQDLSLCKDTKTFGPGSLGYSRVTKFCCCTDRCEEPDGSGALSSLNCTHASSSFHTSAASSVSRGIVRTLVTSLIVTLGYTSVTLYS